ncbi:uncharacterized protein LOC106522867 [Austrofundulus limnaeus]|uniref:Uncharacterized protein LOC106522867 n=1 Tax=Austrofundulus limnaeus TaxID=52670 RepID=A0A2I4BUU7_AUSLI|nr:PREDICTED: uncharacterized protein LOC106522867 [Austrofundulus limnaeus]
MSEPPLSLDVINHLQSAVDELRQIPLPVNVNSFQNCPHENISPESQLNDTQQSVDIFRNLDEAISNLPLFDLQAEIDRLREIPLPVNLTHISPDEIISPQEPRPEYRSTTGGNFQLLEEALSQIQPDENSLQNVSQSENALHELNQLVSGFGAVPTEDIHQYGAGPSTEQNQNAQISTRERFNNHEIRQRVFIPRSDNAPNLAEYYTNVMSIMSNLTDRVESLSRRNDLIQIELSGENVSHNVTFHVDENPSNILSEFTEFLDHLIQSDGQIDSENDLEFIIQIVKNPRGGIKRKAEKSLDTELINKKKKHLVIVPERNDQFHSKI